jgi:hypothetical protein
VAENRGVACGACEAISKRETKKVETKIAEALCALISLILGRISFSAASWWRHAACTYVGDSEVGYRWARCIELRAATLCRRKGLAKARLGMVVCQTGMRNGQSQKVEAV